MGVIELMEWNGFFIVEKWFDLFCYRNFLSCCDIGRIIDML